MTTYDQVLLTVLAVLLSLYFLLSVVAVAMGIKLLSSVKRVVEKAEDVVDSVEEAAEVFKQASGPLAVFKVINNIIKLSQKKGRK